MGYLFQLSIAGRTRGMSFSHLDYYVLADAALLLVDAWPAWCDRCRAFGLGELLGSATEMREEIGALKYFAERPGWIPPDRHVDVKQLPHLRARLRWRLGRVAPARCLNCGATSIIVLERGRRVEIPELGPCTVSYWGVGDVASGHRDRYYSPEGERVPPPGRK